jgi:hypothetical protein
MPKLVVGADRRPISDCPALEGVPQRRNRASSVSAGVRFLRWWASDAKLVSLGIAKHDVPVTQFGGKLLLPGDCGTHADESIDRGLDVVRSEIQMHPILDLFGILNRHELDPAAASGGRVANPALGLPSESLSPPRGKSCRVSSIDGDPAHIEVRHVSVLAKRSAFDRHTRPSPNAIGRKSAAYPPTPGA